MQLIATGNTAEIYLHDGKIVKVFTRESLESVAGEARNQAYAHHLGLPVPAVIEQTTIDGRPALMMGFAPGTPMKDLLLANPERASDYLARAIELQRAVHGVAAPEVRPMSDRLRDQITSVRSLDEAVKSRLLAMLNGIGEETQLCHGDFHVQNLIVNGDDIAIIDWMDATCGSPMLDVCRSYVLYSGVNTEFAEMYLDLFCQQAGWSAGEVQRWVPVIAAARLSEGIDDLEEDRLLRLVRAH